MERWEKHAFGADYMFTKAWRRHMDCAAWHFRWGIVRAKPDARCASLFDREIESWAAQMKANALCQKQTHLAALRRYGELQQGRSAELTLLLENLRQDLRELEAELEVLR